MRMQVLLHELERISPQTISRVISLCSQYRTSLASGSSLSRRKDSVVVKSSANPGVWAATAASF